MAFEDAGLDWVWDEELYGELLKVTGGKQRMKHFLAHFYQGEPPAGNQDELIAQLHNNKNAHYQALLAEGKIPLRSGVKRLILEAMDEGIVVGIATTTTPGNVYSLLKATLGEESLQWFGVIAAGDMVPELKPAPDVYEFAMQKLALSAGECIAVEDSANGVRSAVAAGLVTLVTTNGYTRNDDFSGASLVVDGMGDSDKPCAVISGSMGDGDRITVDVLRGLI
ncbi:unnamed protein product, partial [Cyprideis torosa]